ncbi:hypothetical protein Cgig2_032557 [Carnegiea gigantea]|uniref:MADS-box domain-containing protein n=1 Tax=Carnegiea gigantea TaxID=171969 RepID=A0A9Q1KYN1_9CARY|nr:hypothetical protein Cgig2_032557 [Carnegiea gigantea]
MVGRNSKIGLVKGKKDLMRTFARRKGGIMKKAEELSVLCGVSVGVVIFGPDKGTPHVWPQCTENLDAIIGKYMNLSPHQRNKSKNAMTMADFNTKDLKFEEEEPSGDEEERVTVGEEEGKDQETNCLAGDINIDGFSFEQLVDLVGNLDAKLDIVNSRIDMMNRAHQNPVEFGHVLPCDQAQEMTNDMVQYEELPMPLNFNTHDQLYSAGNCNFMTGDFVNWEAAMTGDVGGGDAGMVEMQEVAQSSWSYRFREDAHIDSREADEGVWKPCTDDSHANRIYHQKLTEDDRIM